MRALLKVNLLGGFQLIYDGKPVKLAHSARLQTFVAYLILHRSAPIAREQLASMFWPNSSERQARTNLRNLIHQLRQALPIISDYLTFDSNVLEWRSESAFRLDIDEFWSCLATAPGKSLAKEELESAVQLYQGDLFPACYDDWIVPSREELREAYLGALDRFASLQEDTRNYQQALQTVRRLVRADPLQPEANLRLMRLYSLVGDHPAALKAYRTYAHKLWQEVEVEPDVRIQDFYQRLLGATKLSSKGISKVAARPESCENGPLVGRTAAWRQLLAFWQNAAAGKVQIVFITGEAGIGKTRLICEFVNWAELQAIPVATAICYPAEGSLPYGPVMSWIRAYPLPALDKVWLAQIGRLLPEVLQKIPGAPHQEPLREAWQRQRLFEALTHALLKRSRAQILVLEDVQWCDRDTLEWMHFLLRFSAQASLLVVVTLRQGEIAIDHPLRAFMAALHAEDRYAEIELHPLTMADSIQLIEQTSQQAYHHEIDADTATRIYQHTEGNPLFLVETVRLGTTLPDNLLAASRRIQAVLGRRLDQLSPGTREVTALAATIGREFDLAVLRQGTGESDEGLVIVIDELLRSRIVQETAPETYDFTHDLLRQAALSRLSMAHRRLLHRKAAEAYVHLDQFTIHPRHAEIASHYERAGLAVQAVHHYRLAAEAAADIFANSNAWDYLRRAVDLAESVGIGDQREISFEDFAMILEKTGYMLALDGKYQQALPYFERALAQPFTQSGIWRSGVYRKISDAWVPRYQYDRSHIALDQAEQALGIAPPGGTLMEQQEWLQIQLDRIQIDYWGGFTDRMESLIPKIEGLVASMGRVGQQNTFLSLRSQIRMRRERYHCSSATVQLVKQRLDQAGKLDDEFNLATAHFQYGFVLLWHGEPLMARVWLERANERLARMGARLPQLRCLAYLSVVSRKLHEPEKLREEIPPLLELARAINEYTYLGIGLANQGWLSWQDGDATQAEQCCQEAKKVWQNFSGCIFHTLADWVLLAVAVAQADFNKSEAAARLLMDPDPTFQPIEEPMASQLSQGILACEAGDRAAALELFKSALAAARQAGEL